MLKNKSNTVYGSLLINKFLNLSLLPNPLSPTLTIKLILHDYLPWVKKELQANERDKNNEIGTIRENGIGKRDAD